MKYFYCQSYQAFNLALAMNLESEVTVVTAAENIIKACEFLKIEYLSHIKFSISDFIYRKPEVDKEVQRLIRIIGQSELHFSHTQFAVFCFYLVKELNDKNGATVFHNFEFVYSQPKIKSVTNKSFLLTKIKQVYLSNKYNLPLEVRMSTKKSFMLSLMINYIYKNSKKVVDDKNDYYDLTLKMFKEFDFNFPVIENLFVAQTFSLGVFNPEKTKEISSVLNSEKIYLKEHPKLGPVKGLDKCIKLPDYLPVELFFQKVKGNVISFFSASLVTATKFDNIKVISLIDLIGTKDSFLEKVKKDLVLKSKNKILFPQSISEVKKLIS